MYITYISVSVPSPWAVTGPHGQLASIIYLLEHLECKDVNQRLCDSLLSTDLQEILDLNKIKVTGILVNNYLQHIVIKIH